LCVTPSKRRFTALKRAGAMPASASAEAQSPAPLFAMEAGTGRNVMLLHGWTANGEDWVWQLPALEARFRTITVDLRGHGRSPVPPTGRYFPSTM
jgi:pimeloyl-ACP methyl ester carboxylesterase